MPCAETGSIEGDMAMSRDDAQTRATRATQLLCAACKTLEDLGAIDTAPAPVQAWWKEHRKVDNRRNANAIADMREALQQLLDTLSMRGQDIIVKYGAIKSLAEQHQVIDCAYSNLDGEVQERASATMQSVSQHIGKIMLVKHKVSSKMLRDLTSDANELLNDIVGK